MAYWEGHKSATSDALVDVLTTAITGSAKPTHSDRILFTACEFWASARNSTLLEQLRDDPISQLQSAETAFGNIGLDGVARIVARGRRMISDRAQPPLCRKSLETSKTSLPRPMNL